MLSTRICDVRVAPSRRGETLAMTLSYTPATRSRRGAIISSPLPFLGGDMDNNVVRLLARVIAGHGIPALRYDYRSVGESHDVNPGEARYETWRRVEETRGRAAIIADSAEALRRAQALFTPTLLGGYSFGCWTATRIARSVGAPLPLVLVAPPLVHVDLAELAVHGAPVLLVFAGDDRLSPTPAIDELHARFPTAKIVVLDAADHFFRDHKGDLARAIDVFLETALSGAEGMAAPRCPAEELEEVA